MQHVTSSCAFLQQSMASIDHLERDINEIYILDEDKYTDDYVDNHDEEQHLNLEEKNRKERNTKSDRNRNDGNSNDVENRLRFGVLHPKYTILMSKGL